MDVREKRGTVTGYFRTFAKEHGFNVIGVEEYQPRSGLVLTIAKEGFGNVQSQAVILDSLLRSTPPRLLEELWTRTADGLVKDYNESLTRKRLGK